MTSRTAGAGVFTANLVAFCVCSGVAFARNINAPFFHYDGSYMLVDAHDQLRFGQPLFAYANNFLQSIGNIQFPQNARLLFFYWPIGWFSDVAAAKVASCLMIAAIVFAAAYAMARLLSQSRAVAIAAGWILGFIATPFVPLWFFYPLLFITPNFVPVIAAPVVVFWLLSRAGRETSLTADAARAVGLLLVALYVIAASSIVLPVVAIGALPYVALALGLARNRAELWRKLAVIAVVAMVATLLRWPWYLLGLFLNTAPNFFPNDFTTVYHDKLYASVMFQGGLFSWAGPLLVAAAALGAILSVKAAAVEARQAAWLTLALIAIFAAAGVALTVMPHWILPPPAYFEVAIWPLYGVFAGVLLVRISDVVVAQLARRQWRLGTRGYPHLIVPIVALVVGAVLVLSKRPTAEVYPYPPGLSPVATILRAAIGLDAGATFRGRVATIIPVKPDGIDALTQQIIVASNWAERAGNDEMSLGLWYYRVPTLFEYNQFISPLFHELLKRSLQRPQLAYQRNMTLFTYANARVLRLLGVRYVLTPRPDASLGEVRVTEDRRGEPWGLVELPKPNLATYSPTSIETRRDLGSMLDFIVDDEGVDLSKQAVAREPVRELLVPARSSTVSMVNRDLRVVAESDGRSLIVVPLEFSHCLELSETQPDGAGRATVLRIDGLLTGIAFERHLDAKLSFRIGPLHHPTCRWQDYRDTQALLTGTGGAR
jgi:hypothetical protein